MQIPWLMDLLKVVHYRLETRDLLHIFLIPFLIGVYCELFQAV